MKLPELETLCTECSGAGTWEVSDAMGPYFNNCGECAGAGFIVTDAGEQLLAFLERWMP